MIDPSKLLNKRMTPEDLSLLFLAGDILQFKDCEQFEFWLFVLNFPLIRSHIKLIGDQNHYVVVNFDFPFELGISAHMGGNFEYELSYSEEHQTRVLRQLGIPKSYPEARLLIRACR